MADTKLAKSIAANGARKPANLSKLSAAISGARPFEPWVIPRLNLECAITLVDTDKREMIEGQVFERMAELKLPLNTTTEQAFELARARRFAVYAVVDRETHEPIGTYEDWGQLDDDQLASFWRAYGDVREAYDPVEQPLTREEVILVLDAIKKKSGRLLRLYGVSRLSRFMLSMGDQLWPSLTQSFGLSSSLRDSSSSPGSTEPTDPDRAPSSS